jgi:hypothetical protein
MVCCNTELASPVSLSPVAINGVCVCACVPNITSDSKVWVDEMVHGGLLIHAMLAPCSDTMLIACQHMFCMDGCS